jgi:LmbE family N-acetylglucosaminyl deacetylase
MIKVLVIAAHPDDEVLGCGGTISRHAAVGDEVHVVILAEGVTSRDKIRERSRRSTELSILAEAAHAASKILGACSLTLHDLPDNRLDAIDLLDVVKLVENHLQTVTPDIVYTHHAGDLNIDHRRVHDAVITACRPLPGHTVKTLLFFEVPSSTEWQTPGSAPSFSPDWFIDVSKTLSTKLQALRAYQAEMKPWPHPRSLEAVEHLARWRGASVGATAAEAYVLGRNVVR